MSQIPKIGDCVITRGYCNRYDGRELTITKINTHKDGSMFFYFSVSDGGFHGATSVSAPNFELSDVYMLNGTLYDIKDTYQIY